MRVLLIASLGARFADLAGPETGDTCHATQNRQDVLRRIVPEVDVVLVVGAANSSNSNRLREIGSDAGVPSDLIADGSGPDPRWLEGASVLGVTAGASAPEAQVQDVLDALRRLAPVEVTPVSGVREVAEFRLPAALVGKNPPNSHALRGATP